MLLYCTSTDKIEEPAYEILQAMYMIPNSPHFREKQKSIVWKFPKFEAPHRPVFGACFH